MASVGKWVMGAVALAIDGVTLSGAKLNVFGAQRIDWLHDFIQQDLSLSPQWFDRFDYEGLLELEHFYQGNASKKFFLSRERLADTIELMKFNKTKKDHGGRAALREYIFASYRRLNPLSLIPFGLAAACKFVAAALTDFFLPGDENLNHSSVILYCITIFPIAKAFSLLGTLFLSAKAALDCCTLGWSYGPIRATQNILAAQKNTGEKRSYAITIWARNFFANLGLGFLNIAGPASIIVSAGVTGPLFGMAVGGICSAVHASHSVSSVATSVATIPSTIATFVPTRMASSAGAIATTAAIQAALVSNSLSSAPQIRPSTWDDPPRETGVPPITSSQEYHYDNNNNSVHGTKPSNSRGS